MRYAAVGDSYSEGLGDELPDGTMRGWTDLVAAGLAAELAEQVDYANFAVRGRLLDPIVRDQLEAALSLSPAPTLITLNGGGNDMLRPGTDVPRLIGLIERALRRAAEAGIPLAVVSGADPSDRLPFGAMMRRRGELLTEATRKLADEHGATLIDVFHDEEIRKAAYWAPDRLHLNTAGHQRVAGLVLAGLGYDRAAHVVDPAPAESRRVLAEARYYREHVLPWVNRRLRGRSSGDNLTGKHVTWTPVPAA